MVMTLCYCVECIEQLCLTFLGHLFNRNPIDVSHVPQYRKDGKASKNACGYMK